MLEQYDAFVEACDSLDFRSASVVATPNSDEQAYQKGFIWASGFPGGTTYNHTLGVNRFSCNSGSYTSAIITAGSRHPGGANTLFVDGHVQFFSQGMSRNAWQALGSRSGGEIVTIP